MTRVNQARTIERIIEMNRTDVGLLPQVRLTPAFLGIAASLQRREPMPCALSQKISTVGFAACRLDRMARRCRYSRYAAGVRLSSSTIIKHSKPRSTD
jgi:hypothetical protein